LEAKDQIQLTAAQENMQAACVECLQPASPAALGRNGETICAECASNYYTPCAGCNRLIPQDEALTRENSQSCADCYTTSGSTSEIPPPDDAEVESLVIEYLKLHAEGKRISDRMNEIKEQLKLAAAVKPRIANAVTLRTPAGAVKCSYSLKINCDPERTAALEILLAPDEFTALFESKVTFKAPD
jgi:hypothetical protein